MSAIDAIKDEARRRHPVDHDVDDPFGATGVARSDPYGYEDTARDAFVEGGEFALSLGEASPIRGNAIVAVSGEAGR